MTSPADQNVAATAKYNPSATKIITRAFRIMATINDEETPTSAQMQEGLDALNAMMKELEATGIHVWTEEEAILFLQQYQVRYLLGSTTDNPTPDHCSDANDWELTSLTVGAIPGDKTLMIGSTTDMAEGDYFGVVSNAGLAFWTTIDRVLSATSVLLIDAIPAAGTASSGNFCFAYTTNIVRPLRIPYARRLQYATTNLPGNGILTPLTPMLSRQDYFNLPNPQNPGIVNQAFYNPARDQGELYVWNAPSTAANGVRFTYYRPLYDFLSIDNTADLPQEWNNALIWNLARELGPIYSVAQARYQLIVQTAADKLELVKGWDRESESVYFGRNSRFSRG